MIWTRSDRRVQLNNCIARAMWRAPCWTAAWDSRTETSSSCPMKSPVRRKIAPMGRKAFSAKRPRNGCPSTRKSSLLATSASNSSGSSSPGRTWSPLRRLRSKSRTTTAWTRKCSRPRSGDCMTLPMFSSQLVWFIKLKCPIRANQHSNGLDCKESNWQFKRLKTSSRRLEMNWVSSQSRDHTRWRRANRASP